MKGEHGISVLAPHTYKTVNNQGKEETQVGFHAATVFDVRQTDGEDLIADPSRVTREEGGELYASMKEYAGSLGVPVSEGGTGTGDGYCTRTKIVINPNLSMSYKVGVLAHELGHILLKHHDSMKIEDVREYEAEMTSFVVCERFGIETKAPHYLKSYGATRDRIKEAITAVSKVSGQIIDGVI